MVKPETHDLSPPPLAKLTPGQRLQLWAEWVDAAERLMMARWRHELGSEEAVRQRYRKWYQERMEEHDQMMLHMLSELDRREKEHAGRTRAANPEAHLANAGPQADSHGDHGRTGSVRLGAPADDS